MRKPPTGEPYAGKPPVRFGGRGGPKPFPTPIALLAAKYDVDGRDKRGHDGGLIRDDRNML
jgi:hypothetical protein